MCVPSALSMYLYIYIYIYFFTCIWTFVCNKLFIIIACPYSLAGSKMTMLFLSYRGPPSPNNSRLTVDHGHHHLSPTTVACCPFML